MQVELHNLDISSAHCLSCEVCCFCRAKDVPWLNKAVIKQWHAMMKVSFTKSVQVATSAKLARVAWRMKNGRDKICVCDKV